MLPGRPVALFAAALLWGVAASCGPGDGGSACPNQSAPSCPSTVPSFAGEVNGIIQRRCGGCHAPGGVESNRPFTSYAQIKPQATGMFGQLFSCRMPPADAPQPTDAERETLLAWFACAAPDN